MIELTLVEFTAGEPFKSDEVIALRAEAIYGVKRHSRWPYCIVDIWQGNHLVTETYDEIMDMISREEDKCPRNAPNPSFARSTTQTPKGGS
jgi:hypothetical protein